jgi:carbamoyltransferase
MSPGDAGASIGAAMFGALKENEIINPKYIQSPFISPRNELSFSALVAENGSWKRVCGLDSAVNQCATLFNQGHVVATCIGAGEVGPRALGHRSLLCNGESDAAVRYLNEIIKGRSSFRPTAPATTLEHANDLYSLDDRLMDSYKVMGATAMAKPSASNLPTTHVDGSARIQIVEADSLIGAIINSPKADFKIVANTSFNFSSDPTVSNIESALLSLITMKVPYFLCDDGLFKAEQ